MFSPLKGSPLWVLHFWVWIFYLYLCILHFQVWSFVWTSIFFFFLFFFPLLGVFSLFIYLFICLCFELFCQSGEFCWINTFYNLKTFFFPLSKSPTFFFVNLEVHYTYQSIKPSGNNLENETPTSIGPLFGFQGIWEHSILWNALHFYKKIPVVLAQ
jgi:hypothetical protein